MPATSTGADLSFPIVMTKGGDVLDGAHRIARAYIEGLQYIEAVVLDDWPPPDGFIAPEDITNAGRIPAG